MHTPREEPSVVEAALAPDTLPKKQEIPVRSESSVVPYMAAIIPPPPAAESNHTHRKKFCFCCSKKLCYFITIITIIIILALVLFLALYIFKARKPKITPKDMTVTNLTFSTLPPVSITLSLDFIMELKNPNYAGWKYQASNTTIYYHGLEVGLATIQSGEVGARSNAAVNISADVNPTAMASSNYLLYDLRSNSLPLQTYTVMTGKVLIVNVVKIRATVYMNCSVDVDLFTRETDTKCRSKVHL